MTCVDPDLVASTHQQSDELPLPDGTHVVSILITIAPSGTCSKRRLILFFLIYPLVFNSIITIKLRCFNPPPFISPCYRYTHHVGVDSAPPPPPIVILLAAYSLQASLRPPARILQHPCLLFQLP